MDTVEAKRRFRLPLAFSIFSFFAILIGLALGAAILITYQQGKKIAAQALQTTLERSAEIQAQLAQRRLEELQSKVQLIAGDASFVQYIDDANRGADLGFGGAGAVDAASINDLLRERQQSIGFDLGLVLNAEGDVLARTDQTEALRQNLKGDAFVHSALEQAAAISGIWREKNQLRQTAIWPLAINQNLVGFLMIAKTVDQNLGMQVGKASGGDVAFLLPAENDVDIVGASLDPRKTEALRQQLHTGALFEALKNGTQVDQAELRFADERWAAKLVPIDRDAGPWLGATLHLASADRAIAGYRSLLNLLLVAGIGSLLIALPLSFLLAKGALRPLRTMAKAMQAAMLGDYQARFGYAGKDELATLSNAFDKMLAELREKRDIETYLGNISRFLPEPEQEKSAGERIEKATIIKAFAQRECLLLGAELQGDLGGEGARPRLMRLTQEITRHLQRVGGQWLAVTGGRFLFGFEGEQALVQALGLVKAFANQEATTAFALNQGTVLAGSLAITEYRAPMALGQVYLQTERLLGDSAPGLVFIAKSLGEAVKAALGLEELPVGKGTTSGKAFYHVAVAQLDHLPDNAGKNALETRIHPTSPPTASNDVRPGALLGGGRYEILGELGAGGMGVVYKARDLELDDVVALKMLKSYLLQDVQQLERLKSEIKLARKITHPNVLRTFDFGEIDGSPFISMEYVRGMTLRQLLQQESRIPVSAAIRIAKQLCAGLAAAHEAGVLHRDIKPENLILEANGNVKLMDFGIARPIQRIQPGHTQPGMFVGTPGYSPPEQLLGENVDRRSDIYAVGILLCEMCCGKVPFAGTSSMEIYMAQMQQQVIKPSASAPDVSPALERIILKCVEKEPGQRYQKVDELSEALSGLSV